LEAAVNSFVGKSMEKLISVRL